MRRAAGEWRRGRPAEEGGKEGGREGGGGGAAPPLPGVGARGGAGWEGSARALGEEGPGGPAWGCERGGRVGNWGCVTGSLAGTLPGRLRWAHGGVNKLGQFSQAWSQVGTLLPLTGPV